MGLKAKDRRAILDAIENEGFEYAFVHYSDFPEVKDPEFRRLRHEFLVAAAKLADYVGFTELGVRIDPDMGDPQ